MHNFTYKSLKTPKTRHIKRAFDRKALARVCEMPEEDFAKVYDMGTYEVADMRRVRGVDDFYHFRDNGSNILAVAHLDTVGAPDTRAAHFVDTEAGPVVFSRALDDRLGAYTILELLPALGITCDVLLTVGEEAGRSTAEFFEAEKDYEWMIEFDRGGTDVVMYQYDDEPTRDLVRASGARVGTGSFSDIAYLEHLGIKGFNWGIGYTGDYHGPRAHAFLDDTFAMVARFLTFHEANAGTVLPHVEEEKWWMRASREDYDWDNESGWNDDHDHSHGDPLVDLDDLISEYPSLAQLRDTIDAGGD